METVDNTLKQRGEVYGDYSGSTRVRAEILEAIQARYLEVNGHQMVAEDVVRIYDIVNKLSRLAVTPRHEDTWLDIAGYATLVRGALNE